MIHTEDLIRDLSLFADLGTDVPSIVDVAGVQKISFVREGKNLELTLKSSGELTELYDGVVKSHVNFKSLLASPLFADLGKWADSQRLQLQERALNENIPVNGCLSVNGAIGSLDLLDDAVLNGRSSSSWRTLVTLIDGPAGIGKTSLLRQLAFRRASQYRLQRRPLILHVESRGRMLQNLTDLMAFGLQTLRLRVTYDQIPVLVRYGLVTLAIDGFDELGDPNGYDLAWAQVNELVTSTRGAASLVLSGRETFIGEGRMKAALKAVDEAHDQIQTFSLLPPSVEIAKDWLKARGWPQEVFDAQEVSAMFEDGSYALRPFFLKELAREGVSESVMRGTIGDLLEFLVDTMIARETDKFGVDIEAITSPAQRALFLRSFLEEVARDMADNQTDAIAGETLGWIAEVVAADVVSPALTGVLKNRASVVAFLENDERRGYRRFADDQIGNYFLANSTIRSVIDQEVPKHLRRNIIGLEFLENFCSASRNVEQADVDKFFAISMRQLGELTDYDRSRRNLAALMLAMVSIRSPSEKVQIADVSLEDALVAETVNPVTLKNVTITQLFAKQADLRAVEFEGTCMIVSLIADDITIPSQTLPLPSYVSLPSRTMVNPDEKSDWIVERLISSLSPDTWKFEDFLKKFPVFTLLNRVARTRSYWLKHDDDRTSRRIFEDETWPMLKEVLLKHGLLLEKDNVGAGGRPATFYHIRNKQGLVDMVNPPASVQPFLTELLNRSYRTSRTHG